jgi:hypothetical protein
MTTYVDGLVACFVLGMKATERTRIAGRPAYIPCQRLADYVHENRYDGIRYPSALNPGGSNIVFFDLSSG